MPTTTRKQNVLIIGAGGGREHALIWKIAQSPQAGQLYTVPGNGGTAALATTVPVSPTDIPGLIDFAKSHDIGLTLVASDDTLAAGTVDAFQAAGLRAFGPTKAAARIEWSKVFSKELMTKQHIPTARYETFTDLKAAQAYVAAQSYPQPKPTRP
jgi:phosphoribosylamine---glycine ligase